MKEGMLSLVQSTFQRRGGARQKNTNTEKEVHERMTKNILRKIKPAAYPIHYHCCAAGTDWEGCKYCPAGFGNPEPRDS